MPNPKRLLIKLTAYVFSMSILAPAAFGEDRVTLADKFWICYEQQDAADLRQLEISGDQDRFQQSLEDASLKRRCGESRGGETAEVLDRDDKNDIVRLKISDPRSSYAFDFWAPSTSIEP